MVSAGRIAVWSQKWFYDYVKVTWLWITEIGIFSSRDLSPSSNKTGSVMRTIINPWKALQCNVQCWYTGCSTKYYEGALYNTALSAIVIADRINQAGIFYLKALFTGHFDGYGDMAQISNILPSWKMWLAVLWSKHNTINFPDSIRDMVILYSPYSNFAVLFLY